ncbi:hypothetical protein EG345_07390 [Chryseobacterium carnipullorum]|nr:hypothetical protein EG345_07390 [Chryseobacterium carnipullorum]
MGGSCGGVGWVVGRIGSFLIKISVKIRSLLLILLNIFDNYNKINYGKKNEEKGKDLELPKKIIPRQTTSHHSVIHLTKCMVPLKE